MFRLSCVAIGKLFLHLSSTARSVLLLRSGLYRSYLASFLPRVKIHIRAREKLFFALFAPVLAAPEFPIGLLSGLRLANRRLPFTMSFSYFYERYFAAKISSLNPRPSLERVQLKIFFGSAQHHPHETSV